MAERLQVKLSISIFFQEKLLGLMSLPTKDQYEELKKRRLHMVRQVKICILYEGRLQSLKDMHNYLQLRVNLNELVPLCV